MEEKETEKTFDQEEIIENEKNIYPENAQSKIYDKLVDNSYNFQNWSDSFISQKPY